MKMKLIFVLLLSVILSGCSDDNLPRIDYNKSPVRKDVVSYSAPENDRRIYRIVTVEHDRHLFIITGHNNEGILHHPDCPCLKK